MLVYLERVAWRMLAATASRRPSLVVLALAATVAVSAATNDWPAVSSLSYLSCLIGRLLSHPCCHKRQTRVHAVNPGLHQTIRDINGNTLLISALATKLIISAAVAKPLIRSGR